MSFLPKVAGTLAGGVLGGQVLGGASPIGTLAGGALGGGIADSLLGTGKKKPTELPPQGQNDPRVMRSSVGSTGGGGYGRGSSSLSV